MKKFRIKQVADLIAQEVAMLIITESSDIRFSKATITGADVSKDLRHAKIYVSILGEKEFQSSVLDALNHAVGFFKRRLGERLTLKFIPEIRFLYDDSLERGNRILSELESLDCLYHPLNEDEE